MEHSLTLILVMVVALGVFSQWLAWCANWPAIVLFLAGGVIVGPLLGWIDPSTDIGPILDPLVSLAVAVILFEGGMRLHWHELRHAAHGVGRLVTLGSILTWGLTSLAAHYIGGLGWPVAILLGAILIVTGPTVIVPMLRQSSLNGRTASYLKWEGIINDPIGALLAVVVFQYFVFASHGGPIALVFIDLGWAILTALALGGGVSMILAWSFNHAWVPEYLKAPVTFACVMVIYVLANSIFAEAGLLAVTVMGMAMGNMRIAGVGELRRFKEYISILMVSTVFVVLTADLDPAVLRHMDWHAVALVAAIIFLVRPASVLLSTLFTGMDWRDRALVAWIAPRGVVASAMAGVFGARMVQAGYTDAYLLLPLIFSVVFATVIVHSFSIGRLARWLNLATKPHGALIVGASPWSTELARTLTNELDVQVLLVDSSWHRLRAARLAGVRVLYGEVLSEQMQESLELNEISCLLAATSNDAYNALVCSHFVTRLEHDRVFQLPMDEVDERDDPQVVARPLRGRPAFSDNAQYEELWRRHDQQWQFHKTRLSDSYRSQDLMRDLAPDGLVIARLSAQGALLFRPASNAQRLGAGDTVIYYAPKTQPDTGIANEPQAAVQASAPAGNGVTRAAPDDA